MSTHVAFSTPKKFNPVSWLVRKCTNSRVSHAFFIYYDQDFSMDMVMEAHELGFRLTPYALFRLKNNVVARFQPYSSIDVGLKYVATRYLGTMYDYTGLVGAFVVVLGRWFKRRWKNPFRSSRSVFCSEAVCIALQKSSGYEQLDVDPDSVDPQTLMMYFENGLGVNVAP